MSFSVKKDTDMYEQVQRPININNSLFNPKPKGVFSFTSANGTFTNSTTFGTVRYNSSNPYNPIYHSTTWSILLPRKTNSAWVGFTTTKTGNESVPAYNNQIATSPSCPTNLSLGNLVFFNISPNNIPYTSNFTISTSPSTFRLTLINFTGDSPTPITATESNSLNISKVPVLFPDNRLVEYLPPECYYSNNTRYFNSFWNGDSWAGIDGDRTNFMTTGVYLTQRIENNLEVSYLNVDFQVVWNGISTTTLALPYGSGVIYMY